MCVCLCVCRGGWVLKDVCMVVVVVIVVGDRVKVRVWFSWWLWV